MISTFPWEWRDVGEVPHIVVRVSREILRETVSATDLEISFVKDSDVNLRSSLRRRAQELTGNSLDCHFGRTTCCVWSC